MKNLFEINKWSIITTFLLYLTIWGGIIAHLALGLIQILMSLIILLNFKKLSIHIKCLFIAYIFITINICLFFSFASKYKFNGSTIFFSWILISLLLALFHLYITFKIKKHELRNS